MTHWETLQTIARKYHLTLEPEDERDLLLIAAQLKDIHDTLSAISKDLDT